MISLHCMSIHPQPNTGPNTTPTFYLKCLGTLVNYISGAYVELYLTRKSLKIYFFLKIEPTWSKWDSLTKIQAKNYISGQNT